MLDDLRFALRSLLKQPAFLAVAAGVLALGIGANTSIYSVVSAVIVRPLPYADAGRLLSVYEDRVALPGDRSALSVADFLALKEGARAFETVAAYHNLGGGMALVGGGTPEHVQGTWVTAALFDTLGTRAALGRTFAPADDRPDAPPVVVLGHGLWQRRFGGDPGLLGRAVTLDGIPHTVIGIMPPGFALPLIRPADLYPLARFEPQEARPPFFLRVVGRPRSGAGEAEIAADLEVATRAIKTRYPDSPADWTMRTAPLKEVVVEDLRPALLMLLGAVSLVLLIASANVASLLLARAAARRKEMAIRAAMGAGHLRLIRQTAIESLLLAAVGGGAGMVLSLWGADLLVAWGPADLPRLGEVRLDGGVLLYALGVTVMTGLLAGVTPALHAARPDLMATLRDAAGAAGDRAGGRLRRLLVTAEFALAVMLLCGASLLLHSFVRLQRVSPGFDPGSLLTAQLTLPEMRYPGEEARARFFNDLLERAGRLPGVRSAAVTMALPPHLLVMTNPYTVEGRPVPAGQTPPIAAQLLVSPAYFRTLGIPLQRGRSFAETDSEEAPGVVIINESMARREFPGQDPVGRRLQTGDPDPESPWLTIVGVVGDVKYSGLDAPPEPTMYTPYLQDSWWPSMYLILRSATDADAMFADVRAAVRALDPELPLAQARTMDHLLHASVAQPRFRTVLVGAFAALAVLLAAVGAYGLLSYAVGRRTREMGVRMALGAQPRDILRLVIGEGMRLAALGTLVGLAGGLALSRSLAGLLFGVSPTDPWTHLVVVALMSGVALLACWLPARRATRVDPLIALRWE